MKEIVILQWDFTPADYFEKEITIPIENCLIVITNGRVEVKVDSEAYDANFSIREKLNEKLNTVFHSAQVSANRPYELLMSPMIIRDGPSGRIKHYIFKVAPKAFLINAGDCHFKQLDKDGNVIFDSKQDRIKGIEHIATRAAQHGADPVLKSISRSYDAAVRDPINELTHLYEIRDALVKKFGNEGTAINAIGLNSKGWSDFGRICNNEPIKKGRHRGRFIGALRDATRKELLNVRGFAKEMIEGYLRFLG